MSESDDGEESEARNKRGKWGVKWGLNFDGGVHKSGDGALWVINYRDTLFVFVCREGAGE